MHSKKQIFELIDSYLGIDEVSKKQKGEVFTPFSLINEMLDTLPKEVWSNPNLKFGDFANGVGNFPAVILSRLMDGLKSWETNSLKRYKHIMENMIYTCDIENKNTWLYMNIFDPENKLKLNHYQGSFLEEDFDNHMKDVWCIDKFDIIVGNPPYQDSSKGSSGASNSTLWTKFIIKSNILTIDEKYLLFITPNSWMGPTSSQKKKLKDVFSNNFLVVLNLNSEQHFDVGSTFSWYLIKKNKSKEKTIVITKNNIKYNLDLKLPFLPTNLTPLNISIIKKILKKTESLGFSSRLRNDKFCDSGKFKVYYSNNFKYSNIEGKNTKIKKIIVNLPGYLKPRYDDGEYATSKNNFWCKIDSNDNPNYMINYLESKIIDYLTQYICKYSGFNNIGVLKIIPKIDFSKSWTDAELYNHFNLTQEEIDLIEKTIKYE
jgi:site-specific DNA-methyltransferase (adenine-specific)